MRHYNRLTVLQRRLRKAGAGVLILFAAAGTRAGTVRFHPGDWSDIAGSVYVPLGDPNKSRGSRHVDVPEYDLAGLVLHVHQTLRAAAPSPSSIRILMKLDVEGVEHKVWPHLRATGAACKIDLAMVEWHEFHLAELEMPTADRQRIAAIHRGARLRFVRRAGGTFLWPRVSHACRLELTDLDDESYGNDRTERGERVPWPLTNSFRCVTAKFHSSSSSALPAAPA